jgi:DNA-binding XRE family transcriptional regulator
MATSPRRRGAVGRTVTCSHCNGSGKVALAFGHLVKARREELGLIQETLAEAVGLSRAQIANIETGRVDTSIEKLPLFAKALKCTPGDLLP